MEDYTNQIIELVMKYAPVVVMALVTLVIGFWIIKLIVNGVTKVMQKRNVDPSLQPFLESLIAMLLKVMLLISVISMLGIEMTSFIAILGAAGLAVGMALSGTLQNFAGGVMILLFKPFKVGDVIEAQGYTGSVKEIQIFNTILKTPDNKTIIIPNGGLSTSSLTNYSTEATRRVDFTFGIGYEDDIKKAKEILKGLIDQDTRILQDPQPFIAVAELADSSVNIVVRTWVNSPDYWGVFFDMREAVKDAFDKEGVNIPYPQADVHVYNKN